MTPETMTSISSDSDSETGSSKNHLFHRRSGQFLPSLRSVVPIILSAPPAKLSWFSSFSSSSLESNKCCAVCGLLPPAGTIAIPFGPRIVRKRKTPLPPHFVLMKVKQRQSSGNELLMEPNGNEAEEGGRNKIVCCCRECVDFFRTIVVAHRDCAMLPASPPPPQLECIDGTENCAINNGNVKKGCPLCWLDRCLIAGLTAQAVANWASNGDRARVEELDVSFQRRRDLLLSLQKSKKMSTFQIVDERVLEFSLLKSLSYSDEQFMTLRLACSVSGRIIRLFRMFEQCTIRDLIGVGPILIGSAYNQKRFLFDILCPQSDASCNRRFDCVFPTYSDGEQPQFDSSEYVTVWLENNDPFLTHIFFTLVDVFMSIELAQTLPVFRLLDAKDVILQLSSTAMHCRMLTQACFSASLDAPELVHPGGILPHRTLVAVVRKAWNRILKKMINFDLKKQENANGTRNNAEEVVERVPVKVLAAPQLLAELEQCSQKNCVDLLKPFSIAKLSATEVLLLRVLILTSPNTPGLSESARLLLGVEWNKYAKLLRNHLRAELGSSEAAEHRHSELIGLLDTVAEMRAFAHRIMHLSFQIFDVPVHCHQPTFTSGTTSNQRSFPALMKECRYAYEANEMQCPME